MSLQGSNHLMKDEMKIGFHTVGLHSRSMPEVCGRVSAAGYDTIELNAERLPWAEPHVTPSIPRDDIEEMATLCSKAGLPVSAICAHIPLVFADREAGASSVEYVKGCMGLAPLFDTKIVHVISGAADTSLSDVENWRRFVDAMAELVDHASWNGIVFAVEPIVGHVCASITDLNRLFADLAGSKVSVNFDPSHFIVQGIEPSEVVSRFGDRIVHVHLKDGLGRFPDFAFPPLGQGEINFPRLIADLNAVRYNGVLSVEYEAQTFGYDWSEDDILAKSVEFAREALAAAS